MGTDEGAKSRIVRTRLGPEEERRLRAYADRVGIKGLSTALRALAFENLALKETTVADEFRRKKAAEDAVKRQLQGGI
tara:strand:- start:191 stop:424 length:234 start_codon:yes stop_codon:yes gene_type:complete